MKESRWGGDRIKMEGRLNQDGEVTESLGEVTDSRWGGDGVKMGK